MITLFEGVHSSAADFLKEEGFSLNEFKGALSESELIDSLKAKSVKGVGIRSKTKITPKVIKEAENLEAIGAFCIGTNQIDLEGCTACLLYTSPSPRDQRGSRMPSSA